MRYNNGMLTLYKAHTIESGAEKVLSELKNASGRNIVIVPDAFTLSLETGALERIGKEGSFDLEVMSFSRLASVVLGKKIKSCLSPAGSVMLLEKVIRSRESELKAYGRAAKKPGFAEEMYAALTAIRNSDVSAESLERALSGLTGYVRDKTEDIVTLYKGYLRELAISHSDSTTRLEALTQALEAGEFCANKNFFVLDYADLNAKQLSVLGALMTNAASLSVAVCVPDGSANRRVYPSLYGKLLRLAREKGISVCEIEVPNSLAPDKRCVSDGLFSYGQIGGETSSFFLLEGKDKEEEVTYLATEITRLVREEKLRYRDICVITPSFGEYRDLFERVFAKFGIPFFADERLPLSGSDLFRHLIAALTVRTENFAANAVFSFVSHELFSSVQVKEKSDFYDYSLKYGVSYSRFLSPFKLGEDDPLFTGAEETRAALEKEFSPLSSLPDRATVKTYAEGVRNYLFANGFDDRIRAYSERIYEKGYKKECEVLRQSPAKIAELLSVLEELRGEDEVTLEEFILAFSSGAAQVKIAALPLSLDCVYFGAVEQAMYEKIPALFILGAEDGLFPLEKTKEGILGEKEYAALRGQNIVIEKVGAEELGENRFHAMQLLIRGDRTYLTHLSSFEPSSCARFLASAFSLPVCEIGSVLSEFPLPFRAPTVSVASEILTDLSRRYFEGTLSEKEREEAAALSGALNKKFPLSPFLSEEKELAEKPELPRTSVSELESYFACPYSRFVTYGLGAKEKEIAKADSRILGIVIHEVAYLFMKEDSHRNISDEEARELGEKIAREILSAPEYKAIGEAEGRQALDRAVRSAGETVVTLKKQCETSSFKPTFFEKRFDEKSKIPALSLDGTCLVGKIDRIDLKDDYAVAIDYKTGASAYTLSDFYVGKKLQLQLYLAVLANAGYKPVAALYADVSTGFKKKGSRFFKGQVLSESWVALGLDKKSESESSAFTSLCVTAEGKVLREGVDVSLVSKEELRAMIAYAEALAKGAAREIKEGFIAPYPFKGGCEGCRAKRVCLHADQHKRRAFRGIKANDFEALAEEGKE